MAKAMRTLHLAQALLPEGWCANVRLTLRAGLIATVERNVDAQAGDIRHHAGVPGIANLHSHAFQRAMAGLAERRGDGDDSFWSWREAMYRFALKMTPEQMQAVAAQAYAEMLEAGFTRVGEFHYLHHAPDGKPYADIAEMAVRIAAAAQCAQINLTMLPVFYAHSGFGGLQPGDAQRRFICDLDAFGRLFERTGQIMRPLEGGNHGLAPHSLRAVAPLQLKELSAMAEGSPIHIHVAEQLAEVDACLAWSGARPVEWLLDHADVGRNWCLVHATHMTAVETGRLAASGATAGLCPVTEANLGDGFFNLANFLQDGGRVGIGTDSNVRIALAEELRTLEYGQRLLHRARNIAAEPNCSTGRSLFDHALRGGAAALASGPAGLVVGAPADIVILREQPHAAIGRSGDDLLDAWLFSGDVIVDCVYARAQLVVEDGAHIARAEISGRFRTVMRQLVTA